MQPTRFYQEIGQRSTKVRPREEVYVLDIEDLASGARREGVDGNNEEATNERALQKTPR